MLREIQPLSHLEIREIRRSFGEMNCLFRWWATHFFFDCSPLLGEGFQFDEHMFQMGWFNHPLVWDEQWFLSNL